MSLENNKKLAQKATLIWSTKDFKRLNEIYAENCIQHQQHNHKTITITGIVAWQAYIEEFLLSYPDYVERIVDQIAEDEKVVTILSCYTSAISWSGITIDRIEQGKIQETWVWFKRN